MVSNTLKVPLVGELPPPDKRVFDNSSQEKPSRKLVTIDDIKFGEVNSKNFEMLRIINYLTLPVIYSENFYEYLTSMRRYSKLAYFKDVLVGGISCKEDIEKSGEHICYIMTINVLKPYQRYGIGSKLLKQAIDEATEARGKILEVMNAALASHRTEMSPYAPRIETVKIPADKIGLLIGPGGKTIKGIVAETGAEINIEDDGSVHIYSSNGDSLRRAKEIITGMIKEIEVGEMYQGTVVTIKEFGCFVEVMPGKDGLVHISELADFRVNKVEDVVKVGDSIWVKCIGVDDRGKVKLSRKAAMKERDQGAVPADA